MRFSLFLLSSMVMFACTNNHVSFQTLEDARSQAKANAVENAQTFRADNKVAGLNIYARGDSTISNECPNGDGWASVDLRDPAKDNATVYKLKCSTVSLALGCLADEDFKTKVYATEDGRCQPLEKVPFPLPKLHQ